MGDIIMTGPAMEALKRRFNVSITLLTSPGGSAIAPFMPQIDEVWISDFPWNKSGAATPAELARLTARLKAGNFDAAIVFTVYSQSALPAAMLAWQAGIPLRLAYCRENPYHLLTHWLPDREPLCDIKHQVIRDMELVKVIGAPDEKPVLRLAGFEHHIETCRRKLADEGIDMHRPFFLFHPGVSEKKRQFPVRHWKELISRISAEYGLPLVASGGEEDRALVARILPDRKTSCANLAGRLKIGEWICLIQSARAIVSVNTAAAHIAAAVKTPVLVLYALTNPQHTPWMSRSAVVPFPVQEQLRSHNQVVEFVRKKITAALQSFPTIEEICREFDMLLQPKNFRLCKDILYRSALR
jgi:ADP-heptose:LPS heptosyltransferase